MNNEKTKLQYGLWKSPISPTNLASGLSFSDVAWDHDGTLVWRESRSDRNILVIQPKDGQAPRDLNGDYNIRAGVGYGGGDFTVGHGDVYFANYTLFWFSRFPNIIPRWEKLTLCSHL